MTAATCHPDRRHKAHGLCAGCYWNENYAKRHPRQKPGCHPDRLASRKDRSRCVECYAEQVSRANDRRLNRESLLRTQYGMTLDDYDELVRRQGNRCLICGQTPPDGQLLHVDHDHETGAIRGLLCNTCNRALGMFGDDLDRVRAAVAYLEAAARRRLAEAG